MTSENDRYHDPIERVVLRRINATFGFAEVRFASVNLHGLKVRELPDGTLEITPPTSTGRDGRKWPAYHLQPHARAAIEDGIAEIWGRSAAR